MRPTAERLPPSLSRGPWIMPMTWHDLLFANWAFPPDVLSPLVPRMLSLDTLHGRAWLAVTPFRSAARECGYGRPDPREGHGDDRQGSRRNKKTREFPGVKERAPRCASWLRT
jgi:uncharacterized protein YqjF (DUF2071 family)